MNIFWTLGSRTLSVTAMLNFASKANTSIHGLGEDDTARDTGVMHCGDDQYGLRTTNMNVTLRNFN